LTHPTGIIEMYVGRRDPERPAVHLRTDGVLRSPDAKEYNAGSRMYGLVGSQLLYAMDMAAVGQNLQSHLSAKLNRVG
ncbi:MAG: FABP family protein, partial [Dermatophilaceae bacterium]